MDFLQRLEHLMKIKGITRAELAAGSGIGKTTVYAWWDKGYEGITLPKLKKLCAYLGCTLDWLCSGDEGEISWSSLSPNEIHLVNAYRAADTRAQEDALGMLLAHPRAKTEENLA